MQRRVADLLAGGGPSFSFEFFPPKTDDGAAQLWRAIRELEPLEPTFVDVTYGAGGSTRDRTLRLVERLVTETSLTVVAHLTLVGVSEPDLRRQVRRFADVGVRNVLALRGDMPGGPAERWQAHPQGLRYSRDLVALVHEEGDFCVGVAAFPEIHPAASDRDSDVAFFVDKCAVGVDFAITQFFFDADVYEVWLRDVRATGCDVPVIPGVMPVTNVAQIERMAELSGAAFPEDLAARLRTVADDPAAVRSVGVEVATVLGRRLLSAGAPGLHFYTLNRSTATREVHARLARLPLSRAG